MYLVVAEKQGADWKKISGTMQNDILKEYIAQKEYIYPPAPSMRLVIDTFEFGSKFTPRFNTISISGYHIREAGSTALQELAFTIYDGVEYVEWARRRGLDVDDFGPRLSFFFNAHNDFFEEIAKYRAARKIWYRLMKDRFGAKNDRTRLMRFHTQTAGVSLPAQQPMNNIARVALQALAAVLGGTQSLHTDAYDEALALPTDEAARIALRTQQIIAFESGVAQTVDPLGGSYFVEKQTLDMENGAFDYFEKLDQMGGMVKAIERGYPQKEIAEASYQYQRAVEANEKITVGVNDFVIEEGIAAHSLHRRIGGARAGEETQSPARPPLERRSSAPARRPETGGSQDSDRGHQWQYLRRQHHALHRRCRPRLRDRRRNLRSPAAGLWNLYRSERHLICLRSQQFATKSLALRVQAALCRIEFLNHSSSHQAALVFWNDHFIRAGVANSVGIALLSGASDDLCFGIEGARRDRDVKIVGVTVDHDTNAARTLDTRLQQYVVTFGVALDYQHAVIQKLAAKSFIGFN